MKQIQTDNSFLSLKVLFRERFLKSGDRVLELFGGNNLIYSKLKHLNLMITSIDKKNVGFNLKGNNIKYLINIDLSLFDAIDLDSYGIPIRQLEIIFAKLVKSEPKRIFITIGVTGFKKLPYELLETLGYSETMIKKCPQLFCSNPFDKVKKYLAIQGVSELTYYLKDNKILYGSFLYP